MARFITQYLAVHKHEFSSVACISSENFRLFYNCLKVILTKFLKYVESNVGVIEIIINYLFIQASTLPCIRIRARYFMARLP